MTKLRFNKGDKVEMRDDWTGLLREVRRERAREVETV